MSLELRFHLQYPDFTLDVDLQLPARGVSVLFGPSGCGKTTLLRCVAGLNRAGSGHLRIQGEVWQEGGHFVPPHQRPLGYVFQDAALFSHLNVRKNLLYGYSRIPAAARKVDIDSVVQLLDIAPLLERKPDQLSGGERQRVAIGRALLTSPKLLLMDEPLAALDQARKKEFLPYLERLHDALDMPVLYVSHAPEEVARLADTLVVMRAGQVLACGPLSETLARLDFPILLGEDSGVVLHAKVVEHDLPWHLSRVEFDGGSLWVRDAGQPLGARVRVRVLARDVSIALAHVDGVSIQNCLPARVEQMADDSHPALTLVRLQMGASALLARLTRRSVDALGLAPGKAVWVQIKAVALVE